MPADIPMTEKELQLIMRDFFRSKLFHVETEVKCDMDVNGKKDSRIDLVLHHKNAVCQDHHIAIEIKKDNIKRGSEMAEWLHQAHRYSRRTFNGFQYHVCIYPPVSVKYFQEGRDVHKHCACRWNNPPDWYHHHYNVNSFLYGAFNVGELQKTVDYNNNGYYRIVINTKIIWDSRYPHDFHADRLPKLPTLHL